MKKPIVGLLIGPPGCGKSTYVRNLLDFHPAPTDVVVASTDDIIVREGASLGLTYDQAWQALDMKVVEKEFFETIKQAAADGMTVIVDRTNMTAKGRKKLLRMFDERYEKVALVFDFSDRAMIEERLAKRALEEGKTIPKFVLSGMYNRYVAPTLEEGFDRIEFVK